MLQGINIEEVKNYNRQIKDCRDKAAKMQAAIEFNQKELDRICAELTKELGKPVTVDNIKQIRDEYIAKVKNTITVGNGIIQRIKSEEALINGGSTVQQSGQTPQMNVGTVPPVTPEPQVFGNMAPAQTQQSSVPPVAPPGFFDESPSVGVVTGQEQSIGQDGQGAPQSFFSSPNGINQGFKQI